MNTFRRNVVIAVLALSLGACGISPEERLDRAREAYAAHLFTEARLDLATVLEEDGNDPAALELFARTLLQLGDGEGAAAALHRLHETERVPEDFVTLMAEAELLRGQYAAALDLARTLDTAEGSRIAALAHVGQGDGVAAQQAFEQGLEQEGDRSRLLSDYALFMLAAGDPTAAQRLAEEALELAPLGLDPLIARARVAQARGDLATALADYEAAGQAWPESRAAALGRIGVLGDLGRLAEARPLVADLARRIPGDPDVAYLQARLAAEDADWSEVRAILQSYEAREDARQQLLYARALVELGLLEQAMPRLTALLRHAPDNDAVRRLLAHAQLASGDADSALSTIRPLAQGTRSTAADVALLSEAARATGRTDEIGPSLTAVSPSERVGRLLAEGDAALRQENWRRAITAYDELRAWTGDSNAMVLNNLAFAEGQAGNVDEAIRLAELALTLAPDHPSVMDTAGWLLVESGRDRSRGLLLLERAAEMAPENATITRHLSEARRR